MHRGVTIPVPGPKPGEFDEYCRRLIAADTKPSPVEKWLQEANSKR
jgi:hypothetical protein